jgi:hypothetical protein
MDCEVLRDAGFRVSTQPAVRDDHTKLSSLFHVFAKVGRSPFQPILCEI